MQVNPNLPERNQWIAALTALPASEVKTLAESVTESWEIRPKALPQSGLGMLKLKDGAFNEPFYLGEIPLATAWLEIHTPDGQVAEGAAQIMSDSVALAEAMAIFDAVLTHRLPGWEPLAELVIRGEQISSDESRRRKAMLASTRVDFSLLDDVGEEDAA